MLRVLQTNGQATVQGVPRRGYRDHGMPWAGAADAVSLGLANALVGNAPTASALELTLGALTLEFTASAVIGLAGAEADARTDDNPVSFHQTIQVKKGAVLTIGMPSVGVRTYLSVGGGLQVSMVLGSASTYPRAGLGGHQGRTLRVDDELAWGLAAKAVPHRETPAPLRPYLSHEWVLRALPSAETALLAPDVQRALFSDSFTVTPRADRMGIQLDGRPMALADPKSLKSAPVFPGTVQCPGDGRPFILGIDAQTMGGYARIAHIARCDRHRLAQLRPGDRVSFAEVSHDAAAASLRGKTHHLEQWQPGISLW